MELNQIIKQIHSFSESNNMGERIVHDDMASELGISQRTYSEYYRGKNQPLAMKVLLRLLKKLDDDQIIKVIRMWKEDQITNRPPRKDKKETSENIS